MNQTEMDTATYRLLKKVLKKIIDAPESLHGNGPDLRDIDEIKKTRKVKFIVIARWAASHYFDYHPELYDIEYGEALLLRGYLERQWNLQSHGHEIDADIKGQFGNIIDFESE